MTSLFLAASSGLCSRLGLIESCGICLIQSSRASKSYARQVSVWWRGRLWCRYNYSINIKKLKWRQTSSIWHLQSCGCHGMDDGPLIQAWRIIWTRGSSSKPLASVRLSTANYNGFLGHDASADRRQTYMHTLQVRDNWYVMASDAEQRATFLQFPLFGRLCLVPRLSGYREMTVA